MVKTLTRILLFLSVATITESYAAFSLGGIPISANKLFTGLLLMVVVAGLAVRPQRPPPNVKNIWLIGFSLGAIPSLGTSVILGAPVTYVFTGALTIYSVVLFYYLLIYTVRDSRDLDIVIWGVFLGAALTSTTAVLGVGRIGGGYYERVGGLGGNPNLAALNAVMGIGLGILLFISNRQLLRRAAIGACMTAQLVAIVLSVSRAGFVCLLAMGGFVLIRSRRIDLLQWAVPAVIVGGFVFFMVAPESYFMRIGTVGEQADDLAAFSLDNKRIHGWYMAIQAFLSYPFTGVGIRTFQFFVDQRDPTIGSLIPHSSYLRLLGTMGLVGFIPWFATVVLSWFDFSRVRRLAKRHLGDDALRAIDTRSVFLQAVFLAWLIAGIVSPFEWDKGPWMLFGLSTAVLHQARERERAIRTGNEMEVEDDDGGERDRIVSPYAPEAFQGTR